MKKKKHLTKISFASHVLVGIVIVFYEYDGALFNAKCFMQIKFTKRRMREKKTMKKMA